MSSSLRYETTQSSREVLTQLYSTTDEEFYTCTIKVPIPRLDDVVEGTLQLELRRLRNRPHSYELSNRDRVYKTQARFKGLSGDEFDVDVIIRTREADVVGATLSIDPQAIHIMRKISEQ